MTLYVIIALTLVTLGLGGALTEIGPWYFRLAVPPWKPPNWAFAPVWSTIGVLTVVSANIAFHRAGAGEARLLLALFLLNAVCNVLWTLLFFKLKRPDWAQFEVVALWLSVLALVVAVWPLSHAAAALLLPYLGWVAVAGALNRAVVRLNPPFGRLAAPS